jgi:hypothetical protein
LAIMNINVNKNDLKVEKTSPKETLKPTKTIGLCWVKTTLNPNN